VNYLHEKGIAHRDIKPDNILISADHKILVIDFNISKVGKLNGEEKNKFKYRYLSHIATPNSQAPELLREGYYTEAIDIWGIGLVMYTLLTGYKLKREAEVVEEQVQEIENVSEECKAFLKSLLSENPDERPTASELKAKGDALW
jgi:serine/threonine protein kinase